MSNEQDPYREVGMDQPAYNVEKKIGIGGRDNCVIGLEEDGGIVPLMIGFDKDGVRFFYNSVDNKIGHSFVIPKDRFRDLIKWLKSWDYI